MIERAFVEQGIKKVELDRFLKSELSRAGFTKSDIVKTPLVTRIVVNVAVPGLAIGKGGQTIRQLTEEIKNRFGIENPQLEIKEIEKPNLDPQVVADRIAAMIERGFSWRSIVFRYANDIMSDGAMGVEMVLSGVLAGKGQRKRKQRIALGYMKKIGEEARLVEKAKADAHPKFGGIGINVRIVKPGTRFSDKLDLSEFAPKKEEEQQAAEMPKAESAETMVEEKASVAEAKEKERGAEERKDADAEQKKKEEKKPVEAAGQKEKEEKKSMAGEEHKKEKGEKRRAEKAVEKEKKTRAKKEAKEKEGKKPEK